MANELRRRYNAIGGLVEDNPLTLGATTLTSAGLTALPAVTSTEHVAIVLDPDGEAGAPEIAYITLHTAGANTATIARGQETTSARAHDRDMTWVHTATALDFSGQPGGQGLIALTTYKAGSDTSSNVTSASMADVDATNLKVDFVVPPSGIVLVRLTAPVDNTASSNSFWGLREGSTTVAQSLIFFPSSTVLISLPLKISGLTPGAAKTYKWGAYSATGTVRHYHGPLYGHLTMEVWSVNS